MAALMDYLVWRGDIPLEVCPFSEIDALAMAMVCYLNFQSMDDPKGWTLAEAKRLELVLPSDHSAFPARKALFEVMADAKRFADIRLHHFIARTDPEKKLQFSAVCADLPDGSMCVCFRGTDGTLVGWREDLDMSYQSPVPAQEAAEVYLSRAAGLDGRPLRVAGHSKGGNLAVYAAARLESSLQARVTDIYTFDGPGMSPEVFDSEGYQAIAGRIRSFLPQSSIVGLMMKYAEPYTVVKSSASGLIQHDPLTWQIYGPHFETLPEVDDNAKTIRDTLHEWLRKTTRQDRGKVVDSVFDVLSTTGQASISDLMGDKLKNILAVVSGSRELDPESRKAVGKLTGLFFSLGIDSLADRYGIRRPFFLSGEAKRPPKKEELPQEKEAEPPKPEELAADAEPLKPEEPAADAEPLKPEEPPRDLPAEAEKPDIDA